MTAVVMHGVSDAMAGSGKQQRKATAQASASSSARHHPYKKRKKGSDFVARFHSSPQPSLPSPSPSANVPSSAAVARSRRPVRLHEHCSTEEQRRWRDELVAANPHIAQAYFSADAVAEHSFPFTRTLTATFPRLPYRERRWEVKSVVPWGQRRLFLSELDFLSAYGPAYVRSAPQTATVVYAGAAPGVHLTYLTRLFPELTFVLYDTEPFKVEERANVVVRREAFTDSAALEWSAADALFVSDVRSDDLFHSPAGVVEAAIGEDMAAQMRWVELMQPHRALLKFRLPWDDGRTMYLQGALQLPVWGSQTTTECRLVPSVPVAYTTYDHRVHEQQMFHFNTRHRVQLYDQRTHGEDDADPTESLADQLHRAVTGERRAPAKSAHRDRSLSGLDRCYDCTAELFILRQFLEAYPEQQQRLRRLAASTAVEAPPSSAQSAANVITSVSPATALSSAVAQQHAVVDELSAGPLRSLRLQCDDSAAVVEEDDGAEAMQTEAEAANAESKTGKGDEASTCVCLDCLCLVLSDELSSELRDGRTLLTAPLLPAAVGTANARAMQHERKARKVQRRQSKKR